MNHSSIAVVSKRAWDSRTIDTVLHTDICYDDKDSGWRIFALDEDDHLLNQYESFLLIPMEDVLQRFPAFAQIAETTENAEFAYHTTSGSFVRIDC